MDERKPKTKRVFTKISEEERLKRKEEAKKYKQTQREEKEPILDPHIDYEKAHIKAMDLLEQNLDSSSIEAKTVLTMMQMYSPDYVIHWPVLVSCQNDIHEAMEVIDTLDDFLSPSKDEVYFTQLKIASTLLVRAVYDYVQSTDVHPELIQEYIKEKRRKEATSKQEVAPSEKKESDSLS